MLIAFSILENNFLLEKKIFNRKAITQIYGSIIRKLVGMHPPHQPATVLEVNFFYVVGKFFIPPQCSANCSYKKDYKLNKWRVVGGKPMRWRSG